MQRSSNHSGNPILTQSCASSCVRVQIPESKSRCTKLFFRGNSLGSRTYTSDPASPILNEDAQLGLLHAQARETKMHRSPAVVQSLVAHAAAPRECGQAAKPNEVWFSENQNIYLFRCAIRLSHKIKKMLPNFTNKTQQFHRISLKIAIMPPNFVKRNRETNRRTILKQIDLGCFPLVRSRVAERHYEIQTRPRMRCRTSRTLGLLNNLQLCLKRDLEMANQVRCGRCRFVSRSLVLSTIRRSAKCSLPRIYFGAHHPSEPTLHCECNSGQLIR